MANLIKKENLKGNEVDILVPHNYPYLEIDLNENMLDYLWKIVKKAKDKAVCAKHTLAGNISNSYQLIDENDYFYNELLKPLIELYFNYNRKKDPDLRINQIKIQGESEYYMTYKLDDFWVNYQYKHEFNPIHSHSGVYSFVIWLKLPYDYNDQCKLPQFDGMKEISKVPGCFSFQYIDILGTQRVENYMLNKQQHEGKMVFFPSALNHQVFPFYESDEERVSISGNIWFVYNKKKKEIPSDSLVIMDDKKLSNAAIPARTADSGLKVSF